jgi:hypothetical protein
MFWRKKREAQSKPRQRSSAGQPAADSEGAHPGASIDLEARLDRVGAEILRAAASTTAESESAVSSPFLYTRVRAAIEQKRSSYNGPSTMLLAARWAIPALALVALASVGTYWFSRPGIQPGNPAYASAYIIDSGPDPTQAATPCSVSNNAECKISIREVLAMMMGQGPGESEVEGERERTR